MVNSRTGRIERVYVDLEAVYPNPDDPSEEYSFEELIVRQRGWLNVSWGPEPQVESVEVGAEIEQVVENSEEFEDQEVSKTASQELDFAKDVQPAQDNISDTQANTQESTQELRPSRARKMKVREVKAEAQTSKVMFV